MENFSLTDLPILWPQLRFHPGMQLFLFLLGLCFGSFITLISYRMVHELPWVSARSQCTACKKNLSAKELIPVVSWLIQGGKCSCGSRISVRYPVIEIITGLSLVATAMVVSEFWLFTILAGLVLCVVTLCVTDFEHYIIPDEIQIAMLLLGVAYVVERQLPADVYFGSMLLGFGIGLALHYGAKWILKKDGLGFGDVKFLAVAGLWMGFAPWPVFFFLSGMLGIATAVVWRLLGLGERFPFGPALAWALLICVFFPQVAGILYR
jgi:prepilin signal peptidase PulO-like enzyme (type II secretory pathway)